jgi:hypothetical protein
MAKIYCNNKQYNGISATVAFVNGVGETNIPHLVSWFQENGYIVEEVILKKDIGDMTYKELTDYAKERGFNGIGYKKQELLKAIQELDSKEKSEMGE